jgi:hypothetical protein
VLALILVPLSLWAAELPKLSAPPLGERWFSVNMSGERVGFAYQRISPSADGYHIESQSSARIRVMGVSREATTKESYEVGRDLAIRSFSAENRIDGSPMSLKGEVTTKGVKATVESAGGKKERTVKAKGPVYPPQVLNFYPLMQGAVPGKTYKIQMLDLESVKVKTVKVEVIGVETLPTGTPALHLQNNLFPVVDNDIWVDLKGDTLKESVRDDLVVTLAESEASAKAFLADAALAKSDLALDLSLVKITPPIERPEQLTRLALDFTGFPANFPLLQGPRQQAVRQPDGKVRFTLPAPAYQAPAEEHPAASDLESVERIPSDHAEIIAQKDRILAGTKDPAQAVRLLVQWVAKEVKPAVTDNQSPVETLKNRTGNCQTHARLYAALARSAGIATRFVSGLVYLPGQGFLYHSWNESYLNGWVSLDPTFGELPANPTHIKLVEGDTPDEMALLAGVIGRLKATVIEQKY